MSNEVERRSGAVDIAGVRARIEHWRRTRRRRSAMPEVLWSAAVSLSAEHGVYRVARALRVDYGTLKWRAFQARSHAEAVEPATPQFVEFDAAQVLGSVGYAVIQVTDGAGAQLRVELPAGRPVDVAGGMRRVPRSSAVIQITPRMRILVAVHPADFRRGIDGLAQECRAALREDPLTGTVFVFRNRRGTAVKLLVYDGQGFWLAYKRLSQGRFRWWPRSADEAATSLHAHELRVLLRAGDPTGTNAAPIRRRVSPG